MEELVLEEDLTSRLDQSEVARGWPRALENVCDHEHATLAQIDSPVGLVAVERKVVCQGIDRRIGLAKVDWSAMSQSSLLSVG
jgi:hypothetical protein